MSMDKKTVIPAAVAVAAVMNVASFALMGYAKRCARQGKWRVPEKTPLSANTAFGELDIRLARLK